MHERPGAIVSMTAAGHDIGKRLSHTPGQAHAPKSEQKLLQPPVASYVEFAVVGTGCPSARPFRIPFRAIPCFAAQEM